MQATLPTKEHCNAKNHGDKKEMIHSYKVIAYEPAEKPAGYGGAMVSNQLHKSYGQYPNFQEIIDLRLYMSRSGDGASPIYGSIWIRADKCATSGTGTAGGYGYHKGSAAAGDAIRSAGVELDQDINGRGDSAIRDALTAIASALGYNDIYICKA